jgi:uncharacterized protein YdcH (DUF465 family)
MATTSLKPIADVQKLAAILAKNLKIVDTYVQRRQEINDALQALEEQNDNVRTESKDLLMQQRLKLEDELPQHLGRIRAVAGHLRRALIDKLNGEMTEAAARVNSVINRLYIIRSTIGVHSFGSFGFKRCGRAVPLTSLICVGSGGRPIMIVTPEKVCR